jgi:hypothetical protein
MNLFRDSLQDPYLPLSPFQVLYFFWAKLTETSGLSKKAKAYLKV